MTVKDVIDFLNDYAPLEYAEDFDNAGLIVGDKNNKVSGILICHDSITEVIDEAIEISTSGRPEPVLVEVPLDIQNTSLNKFKKTQNGQSAN